MLINLTPHAVRVGDRVLAADPRGPARVTVHTLASSPIDGVAVVAIEYGDTHGLPPCHAGVFYVVARLVANANPQRADLVVPDTGPSATRDADGRITSVTRLQMLRPRKEGETQNGE